MNDSKRKRSWMHACVLGLLLSLLFSSGCSTSSPSPNSQVAATGANVADELIGAQYVARWFPRSVRFSPDETHLLVSLCHFQYAYYCRIARYWLSDSRWEVIPAPRGTSLVWPEYSPDGARITYAEAACPQVYACNGSEFALSTMRSDGSDRRALGPTGVQMPTHSPDGSRLLYWRIQGSARLVSGRTIGSWALYETMPSTTSSRPAEKQLTDEHYFGIYGAPRYLPDGERLLYSAYRSDGSSDYTFVIRRDEGMRRTPSGSKGSIPAWKVANTQFIHAFHPKRGWLVGYKRLWFQGERDGAERRHLLDAVPYSVPVADVSPSGNLVAALSGVPEGTMGGGGVVSYWAESPVEGPPRVPVMSIVDVERKSTRPVINWPADVERITRSSADR